MTLPPIVDRELRVAARRWASFWVRLGTALVAVVLFVLIHDSAASGSSSAKIAQITFVTLSVLAFLITLSSGAYLTADCISVEKREGTLGLLFLTDLKGHDVVLGKLAATSINTACSLLAVFPAMALPIVMGGVTGGEFVRVAVALVVTLLLSLSSGLFVSTLKCRRSWAQIATAGAMVGVGVVLPLGWWIGRMTVRFAGVPDWVVLGWSPVMTFIASFDVFHATPFYSRLFWVALGIQSVLTVALLAGSSWALPRVWQDFARPVALRKTSRYRHHPGRSFAVWEKRFLRSGASANPTGWLVWRDEWLQGATMGMAVGVLILWLAIALGCLVVGAGVWRFRMMAVLIVLCAAGHLLLKFILTLECTRRFSLDRQSRALELLLVTPLSNRSIALGVRQALRETLTVPIMTLATMNVLTVVLMFRLPRSLSAILPPGWIAAFFLAGIPLLFTDCYAIGWTGLRFGLSRRRHHLAVRGVFLAILLPPWILAAIVWGIGTTLAQGKAAEAHLFMFWFLVTLLLDVSIGAASKFEVFDHLRHLVAEGRIRSPESDSSTAEPATLALANP